MFLLVYKHLLYMWDFGQSGDAYSPENKFWEYLHLTPVTKH